MRVEAKLEKLRASQKLGWNLAIEQNSKQLALTLTDSSKSPISNAKVKVNGIYPANSAYDLKGSLVPKTDHPGVYKMESPLPATGPWVLEIEATTEAESFFWKEMVVIR